MSETAQATMGVQQLDPATYRYTITLLNTSTTAATIGAFWFAWDDGPDANFLTSDPTVTASPPGWGATITHHTAGADGYGIEWAAASPGSYLGPGQSSAAFAFTTPDPPAALLRLNTIEPATGFAVTHSFVYAGAPEADPGFEFTVPCLRAGTRILTPAGSRAIDDLEVETLVATHGGRLVSVRSIERRRVACRTHPRPREVWPVRIRAAAFGPDRPETDLWLSPDHAVFVAGALIPVRYLVNGTTVVQEPCDEVTYLHLELPRHDVILAEGLPVESYLDTRQAQRPAHRAPAAHHFTAGPLPNA